MAQGSKLRVDPGNCFPRQRKQASEKSVPCHGGLCAGRDARVQRKERLINVCTTESRRMTSRGDGACARMLAVHEEVALLTRAQ